MTVAEIIRTQKDNILESWVKDLKERVPEVMDQEKAAIQNSIPELIDALVKALKDGNDGLIYEQTRKHAMQRTDFKAYSLKHVIKEYNLLKEEIFHVVDEYSEIDPGERDTIMFIIDRAIEQAAETFYRIKEGVHVNARTLAESKANDMELQSENREDFINSISHDLNTPLNNIKGAISLLESDLEIEQVSKILEILKGSAYQAELLIRDFLEVNLVSPGKKLPVKKVMVNVLEDLENEINIYKIAHKSRIELRSSHDDITVKLDINLLRRAFNNLLSNAIRHGKRDSIIIVTCSLVDDNLLISVNNKGKLIPDNSLEEIFKRYYKIDSSGEGWGIGLAFVKGVAEAHGGDIKVTSTVEDGTTFILKIPV